jgi:beta-barrel assembly-enhancing protease
MSQARAERLQSELAALPKTTPEPFTFDWTDVRATLGVQPEPQP